VLLAHEANRQVALHLVLIFASQARFRARGSFAAKKVKAMNIYREALRLILTTDMSNRLIGRTFNLSHNTVKKYRSLVNEGSLDWAAIAQMDDTEIEGVLKSKRCRIETKFMPDWATVHREMQFRGVTLQLLWEEYRLATPGNAYSYSQFTHYYRQYVGKLDLTMRQQHLAGQKTFVDFAGWTFPWTNIKTAEEIYAQVFIGVLGCSKYTFACAVKSQAVPQWIEAHNKMLSFYGGVTEVIVPDNLKSAVTKAGSEPEINRTYLEFSKHNGTVIIPTGVRRPKDKASAELGVKLFYRWIRAKLRHRKFFSIEEINQAIEGLLKEFNERPFKELPGCRRSRFEELDKPLLRPLPSEPFEYAEWTAPYKVGPDYHVKVKEHYYSVPHELVTSHVEARITSKVVEIFHKGRRVATHLVGDEIGGHTTNPTHQPKAHRAYADQKPELILKWAKSIGPAAETVIQHQFDSRPHALLAIKSCASLQRLAKHYGVDRFEAACLRAIQICSLTTKSVRSILQHGLDGMERHDRPIQVNLPLHDNVRGAAYYAPGGQ